MLPDRKDIKTDDDLLAVGDIFMLPKIRPNKNTMKVGTTDIITTEIVLPTCYISSSSRLLVERPA